MGCLSRKSLALVAEGVRVWDPSDFSDWPPYQLRGATALTLCWLTDYGAILVEMCELLRVQLC